MQSSLFVVQHIPAKRIAPNDLSRIHQLHDGLQKGEAAYVVLPIKIRPVLVVEEINSHPSIAVPPDERPHRSSGSSTDSRSRSTHQRKFWPYAKHELNRPDYNAVRSNRHAESKLGRGLGCSYADLPTRPRCFRINSNIDFNNSPLADGSFHPISNP